MRAFRENRRLYLTVSAVVAALAAASPAEAGEAAPAWAVNGAFLGVQWLTWLAAAGVLVAVLAAHGGLRWIIQRKIRNDQERTQGAPAGARARSDWIGRGLRAAMPPLAAAIWVAGAYGALTLFARDLLAGDVAASVLRGLDVAAFAGILAMLFWLVQRVTRVLERQLDVVFQPADSVWDRVMIPFAVKTVRLTLPLLVLILGIPHIPVSPQLQALAGNGVSLLIIGAVALVLFQVVQAVEAFILARHEGDTGDPFRARRIRTQVTVLRKIVVVVIGVFALASMLMVFDSVRQFGTSLLASAGIAGIILGLAAQRSLATLLAGFQIAFTRPIRIDDVVIVEGEWGRVEDITLTFVIVCIWDQRRLILPITYFMEKPFQNWTSTSSDILGTVFLHVDYTMPIDALRAELDRILENSTHWDGRYKSILVTDAKEHTLEVRAMASAKDGDAAWFLRCEIREKLIAFIRERHPESLPRLRAELRGQPAPQAA